jgi:hypothetical protein
MDADFVEDDGLDIPVEWGVMQYSTGTNQHHPTELDSDSIKVCGSDREITWSSVYNFIKTPVRASAEMLEEADVDMDASSLEKAGVCKEDIPILLDACDKLRCSLRQKNPTLGTYSYYGKADAYNVYQTAFILIEVPPWGDSPRKPAADLESPGAEKKEKVDREYRHIFDDGNKKNYCWY